LLEKNMSHKEQEPLFTEFRLGELQLKNRIVMASLTRGRADNAALAPTALHTEYYGQRASAGLILTESAWVSKNAIGYVNLPGIYSGEQVLAWKQVTGAVHEKGGKIILQLAHSGAVSHPDFFGGSLPLGPSAINPREKSFTPQGFKDTVTPRAYTIPEIKATVEEFRQAAQNAREAGFDGIEIHAQLFTLIPQFLSPATNQRTDEYGGSMENRVRIVFEILDAVRTVFDIKRIGIKFTPAFFSNGLMRPDSTTLPTFAYLLEKLSGYDLGYVHLVGPAVDLTGTVLEPLKEEYFGYFRQNYKGTLMANLGFTHARANEILAKGHADLVSFGTPFIANPDLVERFQQGLALAVPDTSTFYTGGATGYTDYPVATEG
jgi:N-ethylmaleimide reductase